MLTDVELERGILMNRRPLRWPVLALLSSMILAVLTLCAIPSYAQGTTSGTITGTVVDPTGVAIPGASITVTDLSTGAKRTTVSSAEGQYVLVDIPIGTYSM